MWVARNLTRLPIGRCHGAGAQVQYGTVRFVWTFLTGEVK
ncbi:hypothetical protein FTUN_2560 [Frigoriglobus tundricola]|uniref:Uncharacterized protein n=1 Tax=Frigoriglobus tundricola TaxID=2774151 RepID=A0A6M5YN99_9BACT|nr:hypothetical protein FTUN_2560 [Frigoriglobus tundricola]